MEQRKSVFLAQDSISRQQIRLPRTQSTFYHGLLKYSWKICCQWLKVNQTWIQTVIYEIYSIMQPPFLVPRSSFSVRITQNSVLGPPAEAVLKQSFLLGKLCGTLGDWESTVACRVYPPLKCRNSSAWNLEATAVRSGMQYHKLRFVRLWFA